MNIHYGNMGTIHSVTDNHDEKKDEVLIQQLAIHGYCSREVMLVRPATPEESQRIVSERRDYLNSIRAYARTKPKDHEVRIEYDIRRELWCDSGDNYYPVTHIVVNGKRRHNLYPEAMVRRHMLLVDDSELPVNHYHRPKTPVALNDYLVTEWWANDITEEDVAVDQTFGKRMGAIEDSYVTVARKIVEKGIKAGRPTVMSTFGVTDDVAKLALRIVNSRNVLAYVNVDLFSELKSGDINAQCFRDKGIIALYERADDNAYSELKRRHAKAGTTCPPMITPQEYANALREWTPVVADKVKDMLEYLETAITHPETKALLHGMLSAMLKGEGKDYVGNLPVDGVDKAKQFPHIEKPSPSATVPA